MAAGPGSKTYGTLSVWVQLYSKVVRARPCRVELHPYRERPVRLAARAGGHAFRHLSLHHDAIAAHARKPLQRLDDERTRHRVGKIACAQTRERVQILECRLEHVFGSGGSPCSRP